MASKRTKSEDGLNLTREESESLGVRFPEESEPVSVNLREHPLHEQIRGSLTENDVAEALTGEVTPESREVVEDLCADMQEEEADRQEE